MFIAMINTNQFYRLNALGRRVEVQVHVRRGIARNLCDGCLDRGIPHQNRCPRDDASVDRVVAEVGFIGRQRVVGRVLVVGVGLGVNLQRCGGVI